MESTRLLWSKGSCAIPWLALAGVLAVAAFINRIVDVDSLWLDAEALVPSGALENRGDLVSVSKHLFVRLAWGIPAMGFALVAIAALAIAAQVFWSCVKDLPARERLHTIALSAGLLLLVLALAIVGGDWVLSEPTVTSSLRKATMHKTAATHAVEVDTFFDYVACAIFGFLVSAASAILVSPRHSALSAANLGRRIGQLRMLLYVGATALVLRAIEMYSLYRWPGAWLQQDMAALVDSIALALSTAHGAFFSAVLLSLYVPTAFVLRARARWLANHVVHGNAEERNAWLIKVGLGFSPFQELAGVLVTVTPLIAGGSVTKLIELLNG